MGDSDKEAKNDPEAMDSDEEDEDYVPGGDPGAASDDDENDAAGAGADDDAAPLTLSITKQKAVDDAFFDLFGYHYNDPSYLSGNKSLDKLPTKSKRTMSKQRSILSSIFGKQSSMKIMAHARSTAALARSKPSSGGMLRLEKRVIVEVKRFAGQEIKVEKVVFVPVMAGDDEENNTSASQIVENATASEKSTAQSTGKGKAKGVDNLLTELAKPDKLSTISKTSADWDLFKAKNADAKLKEQLENKAKGNEAYLVKKDFLNRVDRRRFELEKKGRDVERTKRGK